MVESRELDLKTGGLYHKPLSQSLWPPMQLDSLLPYLTTKDFPQRLKQMLLTLPTGSFPLEPFAHRGGVIDESNLSIMVINVSRQEQQLTAKLGVFFTEIMSGCGCTDDDGLFEEPTYGEFLLTLDCTSGEAQINHPSDLLCI